MKYADEIILNEVGGMKFDGDKFFPKINCKYFKKIRDSGTTLVKNYIIVNNTAIPQNNLTLRFKRFKRV